MATDAVDDDVHRASLDVARGRTSARAIEAEGRKGRRGRGRGEANRPARGSTDDGEAREGGRMGTRVHACANTVVFARAVVRAMERDDSEGTRARRRGTDACVARRRNERTGAECWTVIARASANGGWGGDDVEGTRTMCFRIDESGEAAARTKAAEFTTTATFDAWVLGSKCTDGPKKAGLGSSTTRARKHHYAYSGIMGDDVIDCACGDNEEYGFMVACETCGVWEHGPCCDIHAEEEIPKDYMCSRCVRRDEKSVVVLDFASEEKKHARLPLEDEIQGNHFGTVDDVVSILQNERIVVCCLCGCEDCDGDYAPMVRACACRGGGAIAHLSCMKSFNNSQKASNARARGSAGGTETTACKACGDFGGKASGIVDPDKVDEILRVLAKAVDDAREKNEEEMSAYRANPRQRRPKSSAVNAKLKNAPESKAKVKVEQKRTTGQRAQMEKATGTANGTTPPPTPPTAEKAKLSGTPTSMLPLKKRRMIAWDSEQKVRSSVHAKLNGLAENVKPERLELTNNID